MIELHPQKQTLEKTWVNLNYFRGCLALATKGQKFKRYSQETKLKAIELKLGGKTKREIIKVLGIEDEGQIKIWMRKYKQLGEYRLMDNRGRREEYIEEERYTEKLKRENDVLKKCLEIWIKEVRKVDTKLQNRCLMCIR